MPMPFSPATSSVASGTTTAAATKASPCSKVIPFTPPAAPHPGIVDPPWRIGGGPAVVVDLHVDADRAAWAERHLGADAVRERGASGTRFAVEVTNVAAFRSFVLMFLDRAEVLGPPEVRDDIVAWLEAISAGVAS